MQRPIAILLAAVLAAGILGPLFLAAQNDDNATSTDPIIIEEGDSATTTDDGATATSTEATPSSPAGGQAPVDTGQNPSDPIKPAESPLTVVEPKKEAAIVPKLDPVVMAVWTMRENGQDDSSDPLGQILPSGNLDVDSAFQICAAVRPGDNSDTGFGVYSQFTYPKDAAFGPNDADKRQGCGQTVSPICQMKALKVSDGLELLCQKIKKDNENLPVFADNGFGINESYDYDNVCADLEKQTASIYCCGQSLAYDDISGSYTASVIAQNDKGIFSNLLLSEVQYLPLTSVQVDFNSVNYGSVATNVDKTARYFAGEGDKNLGAAYIHNIGNTRVHVSLLQDDMGLGKTGDHYNIRYNARYAVGNNKWIYYWPNDYAVLPGEIDLSTSEAVELGVTVFKYPDTLTSEFHGSLTVNAAAADHYQCADK